MVKHYTALETVKPLWSDGWRCFWEGTRLEGHYLHRAGPKWRVFVRPRASWRLTDRSPLTCRTLLHSRTCCAPRPSALLSRTDLANHLHPHQETIPKTMAQKSITNFFKPLQDNKRKISDEAFSKCNNNKKFISDKSPLANNPIVNSIQDQIDALSKSTPALSSNIGHSWFLALKQEFSKPYFKKLSDFIEKERAQSVIYPPQDEVFSWTQSCKIKDVKVIILGQDPYHGPKQAHGLAFSVKKGIAQPPSLVNIFKEVKNNYSDFEIPKNGELTGWAQQGVLLLNACLTVKASNANSHSDKGWEMFTDSVIKYFNANCDNRVFLLWGAYAQKKGSIIDQKKHLVLKSVHPSPLSAHRGFLGCEHFKRANDYLDKNGLKLIDWTKLE